MQVHATLGNLRIAPRKVRLIADLIRRKKVEDAQVILQFMQKKAGPNMLKLLNSAAANATNTYQLDAKNLYISKITVDEGRKLKRWMPRARGRAAEIQKKTSFITIVLDEIKPTSKKKKKVVKTGKEITEVKSEGKEEIRRDFKQKPRFETDALKPKHAGGVTKMFRRKVI
jgi:large subunit ribosomal protein L22